MTQKKIQQDQLDPSIEFTDPNAVTGPASSTDNAIPRFDGTTGKLIQSSDAVLDDSGRIGLGTTPTVKLDINEPATNTTALQVYTGGGSASAIIGASASRAIHFSHTGNALSIMGTNAGTGGFGINGASSKLNLSTDNAANPITLTPGGGAGDVVIEGNLKTDTVSERTSAAGVTIDGVKLKDGMIQSLQGDPDMLSWGGSMAYATDSTTTPTFPDILLGYFANSATGSGWVHLVKGRGTVASPSAVLAGDDLGRIAFSSVTPADGGVGESIQIIAKVLQMSGAYGYAYSKIQIKDAINSVSVAEFIPDTSSGGQHLQFKAGSAVSGLSTGPAIQAATEVGVTNVGIDLRTVGTGRVGFNGVAIPSISSTDTLTNKTIALGSNTVSGTAAQFDTAVTDENFVYTSNAQSLTNKRITPRVQTQVGPSGTYNIASDSFDSTYFSSAAGNLTFGAPSGGPMESQKHLIRIKDNGTARTLTWNAIFRAIGVTLPTTTVVGKTMYIGMVYNSTDTKWDVIAVSQEA